MTNPPYGNTPGGHWPPPGTPAGPPPAWPPVAAKQPRLPIIISLVVALIAVAVAIGAWFRPMPAPPQPADSAPKYSEQQIADSKKALCDAHDLANRVNQAAGTKTSDDPTLKYSIAINIRLAGIAMADYMLAVLDANPATPDDFADSVRQFAMASEETSLLQMADGTESELDIVYKKLDATEAKVAEACK